MKTQKSTGKNICSIQDVQNYVNNNSTSLTAFIQSSISAVSMSFENYIGCGIAENTYTDYMDGTGTNMLMLKQIPIISISTVQYRTSPTGTFTNIYEGSLTANIQYTDNGWVELWDTRFPEGKNNIKIVYNAGYSVSSIPADIKQVCIEEVAMLMDNSNVTGVGKGNLGIKNKSNNSETYAFENISSSTEKVLDYYKKITL